METLVGTFLLVLFCILYFPPPEKEVGEIDAEQYKLTVINSQEISCKYRIKRLYSSYNLKVSDNTLEMLCVRSLDK